MPRFKDAPLEKDKIRLFRTKPNTDAISLEVKTFNIYRAPKYQCISYCWGDRSDGAENILCNSKPMEVWINLHAALRRLWRESFSSKEETWYWNDAISIEQGNESVAHTEKASQIGLMETIFLLSDPVRVWLGDASADEEHTFQYLADTCERLAREGVRKTGAGLPDSRDNVWRLWSQVILRPWFTRLWIVQECVFIKGQVLITMGSKAQTTWEKFYNMIERTSAVPWMEELLEYDKLDERAKRTIDRDFLLEWGVSLSTYENHERGRSRNEALKSCVVWNIVNIRELMYLERSNDTDFGYFAQILKVFGNRKCTYSQDRPNAMRGLLPDPLKKGLKVYDIHADIASVYREVSRIWLTNDPMLSVLQRARPLAKFMPPTHAASATKLTNPSWVIDLSRVVTDAIGDGVPFRTDGFHAGLIKNKTLLGKHEWIVPETKLLSRMRGTKHINFPNGTECHVAGVEVGTVRSVVYSHLTNQTRNAARSKGLSHDDDSIRWLNQSLALIEDVVANPDLARDVHWRALVLNQTYTPDPDVKTMFDIEDKHSRREEYDRMVTALTLKDPRPLLETNAATLEFYSVVFSRQYLFPNWFSISTGHVGRSLAVPKAGDIAVVLYGAATPYLLRPVPNHDTYEFMGEAYVHGVMQGEALFERNKDKYPKQVFKLT